MKRLTGAVLAGLMLLGLCACGGTAARWQEQYDLGVKYLEEGNYQEAILAFTAAIEIDTKQAPAYVGRGDAYIASITAKSDDVGITDAYKKAEENYLKAIELEPVNTDVYMKLAKLYIDIGDMDSANLILQQGYQVTKDQRLLDMQEGISISSDTDLDVWSLLTLEQKELLVELDNATQDFDGEVAQEIMQDDEFAAIFDLLLLTDNGKRAGNNLEINTDDGRLYRLGLWTNNKEPDYWFDVMEDYSYREAVYWTMGGMGNRVGIGHMLGEKADENGAFKKVVFLSDGRVITDEGKAGNGLRVGTETITYNDGLVETYEFDQTGRFLSYSNNGSIMENAEDHEKNYPMQAFVYRG